MATKRNGEKKNNPAKRNTTGWFEKFIDSANPVDFERGLFKKVDFDKLASWLKKSSDEAKAQRDRFYSMLCNVEYLY